MWDDDNLLRAVKEQLEKMAKEKAEADKKKPKN